MKNYSVKGLEGPKDIVERLFELGFSAGEKFQVLRQFPFKGPWVLMTSHGMVALRDEEYHCLIVESEAK